MALIKIECAIKKYSWGKRGSSSAIAQIMKKQNSNYTVEENTCYAELWMGTHPSGPSIVALTESEFSNHLLTTVLNKHPEYVGDMNIITKHGNELPFLFKVLSIEKALSIQSHPDIDLAKLLHERDPVNYPDANHKPEMVIAVTDFQGLASFRPLDEIQHFLLNLPELKSVLGEEAVNSFLSASAEKKKIELQNLFTILMKAPNDVISANLNIIGKRWTDNGEGNDPNIAPEVKQIFLILIDQYPDDVGCFSIFFLNYIKLKPGESFYIPANEPHCYIYGDCIECMACSDNVIRAGLTPKYKDINTLCVSLTYRSRPVKEILLKPFVADANCTTYKPAAKEFQVDCIKIGTDQVYKLTSKQSGSFLIVWSGCARTVDNYQVTPGATYFIPANIAIKFNYVTEDLVMYRCYCVA